ncbi:hypothetical protein DPX16_0570 [Anabarilius grahami]|uniref:Uncharacterized protein n=1 Tax=Anabarilius grahami TaxID=495550 RepID=A0A3N0XLF2_ANAGA|nr:hypothetical protein DPX16_0570 [Anabarilius grahami]
MSEEVNCLKRKYGAVESKVSKMEQTIFEQGRRLAHLESYSRRWNLRIHGVPEKEKEEVNLQVIHLCQRLLPEEKDKLQIAIDIVHWLGRFHVYDSDDDHSFRHLDFGILLVEHEGAVLPSSLHLNPASIKIIIEGEVVMEGIKDLPKAREERFVRQREDDPENRDLVKVISAEPRSLQESETVRCPDDDDHLVL